MMDLGAHIRTIHFYEAVYYAASIWLAYWIAVGIYRIWFHPLAKFPGPKLAALTYWYEFYYEVYPKKFQYLWKIKEMHEKYGPIIRINPNHIHINDSDYFSTIHASGNRKRNRDTWYSHSGAKTMAGAMLETIDHDLHRSRRSAVSNFFSRKSIQELNPLILDKVEILLARLKSEAGQIVVLNDAMAALTMDVISAYCFGEPMGSLSNPEYGKQWLDALHQGVQARPLARQFPSILNFMIDLPPSIMASLDPKIAQLNEYNDTILRRIERVLRHEDEFSQGKSGHKTVFHAVRDGDLPEEEKAPKRLAAEGSVFMGAGTETTARTLSVGLYYLLMNEEQGQKLSRELRTVLPRKNTQVSLPQLESLEYLTAVINEALRCAHGVSSRQPRVPTQEDLQYKQWTIPRGTPVMESPYLMHTNPEIFPEPLKFRPERWIEDPKLKKQLYAFGGGSRNCLGINLAFSELYFCLAYLWRTLKLEVHDTVEERDVLTTHDCFIGMPNLKSEGIKVKIIGEVED